MPAPSIPDFTALPPELSEADRARVDELRQLWADLHRQYQRDIAPIVRAIETIEAAYPVRFIITPEK